MPARLVRALPAAGLSFALLAGLLATTAPAAAAEDELVHLPAAADTWVGYDTPTTARGAAVRLEVDGSPTRHALMAFDLAPLAGRTVTGVRLRLHQVDQSRSGGVVRPVMGDWDEAHTTWDTRPALAATALASFGTVAKGSWYEVALPPEALTGGLLSLGITSSVSDGVTWTSRESATPPALLVTVAGSTEEPPPPPPPADETDGLTPVMAAEAGSSEPTYFSDNRRVMVTESGRTLAVTGQHASGISLSWRDPGGTWQRTSTGANLYGAVLEGAGTGDWPASVAVGRDATGAEVAWVVWSAASTSRLKPVQMRRLTDLDAAAGPRLGPVVTVDPAPRGAMRADVAFERAPDGTQRGCVLYTRRVADKAWELTTACSADLASDAPAFGDRAVLLTTTSSKYHGSLVPTAAGLRAVARAGKLRLFGHDPAAPLSTWWAGAAGPNVPIGASPTGVALADGSVVVAFEADLAAHVSSVHRFAPDGRSVVSETTFAGTAQPALTTDGTGVWLVGARPDGALVSRARDGLGAWSTSERVEVAAEAVGPLTYPNLPRESAGRLQLVAEGPGASDVTSSVWAWSRAL